MNDQARSSREINGKDRLAGELHAGGDDHNPGLRRFIEGGGPAFHPHRDFKKAGLDRRQALYQMLAEQIWSGARLEQESAL